MARGSFSLEALLVLSAYALLIASFAGLQHSLSERLAQEAGAASSRAELSSACLSLDWFSLAGERTRLALPLNASRYSAAGRSLAGGGARVECRSELRSEGGELRVRALAGGVRG